MATHVFSVHHGGDLSINAMESPMLPILSILIRLHATTLPVARTTILTPRGVVFVSRMF